MTKNTRVTGGTRRRALPLSLAAGAAALAFVPAGCGDDDKSSDSAGTSTGGTKAGKVAVLLADSKSSVRWETVDRPLRKSPGDVAEVALFALTRPRGMRLMTTTFRPMSEASWG